VTDPIPPAASDAGLPVREAAWLRRAARAFQILALLLLPALFVQHARGNLEVNDFSVYYTAARATLDGIDPYSIEGETGRPFVYPPGFAALIAPLAILPYPAAAVLWTALGFGAVLASLWLCLDLLGIARGPIAWTVGGLALVCSGRMLDSEFGNGQANHWVLLGLAAFAWLSARGRPILGGVALSLAIVAKVTPLLLAVYLAGKREWRALAGVSAGLLAFGILLPALALGPRGAVDANRTWAGAVLGPVARSLPHSTRTPDHERPGRVHGVSLRALAHRHLTWSQAASHVDAPVFVNTVAWSSRTAELAYRAVALLALAAAAFALGVRPPRDGPRWLLEVAIVATTMVLIAPLSRKAHFIVLMLPFVYGVALAAKPGHRAALAWVLPPALVFISTSPAVLGRQAAALALAWGAYTAAAIWLWAGALLEGRRSTQRMDPRPKPQGDPA
jgi:hypothetical protein